MYSPKIDLVFRKLFGTEENKDLLISLINAILDPVSPITTIELKNPYNLADYVGGKVSIVDIKAQDAEGTLYDIELQIGEQDLYGKRVLYYLSKLFVDQLEQGQSYASLHKTIAIHLIDFDYFPGDRFRRHFVFKEMETNECPEGLQYQQIYFIEMHKFRKDWGEIASGLDRWIVFLNKAPGLSPDSLPPSMQDSKITTALHRLETLSFDKVERQIYEAELKTWRDEQEKLRTAALKGHLEGLSKGLAEGHAEGHAEGRAEGVAEGLALGMQAALEKLIAAGISEANARQILGID